jgi:hypothetical protein
MFSCRDSFLFSARKWFHLGKELRGGDAILGALAYHLSLDVDVAEGFFEAVERRPIASRNPVENGDCGNLD